MRLGYWINNHATTVMISSRPFRVLFDLVEACPYGQ